ncbi:AAA family ATPase [uncultured Methanobrevibacter sp.]|uniref:AAA family ATPase n=1 Tax=uncultured Methanobrevibacter sp. TaxID=253161 RepID=UPI00260C971A|nr:AAA family ATPase [uncultured Methanobrevibacter sp.]
MAKKGLGKGLASLIPDFYNEDFDSNSTQSLEELLNEDESDKNIFEQLEEESNQGEDSSNNEEVTAEEVSDDVEEDKENEENSEASEDLSGAVRSEEDLQTPQEIKIQEEHVAEVKEIVDKNPRITLWSSRSSAVFRYLRKTEPEFSISKEASILIDEAVAKKYPEIWALFDDY